MDETIKEVLAFRKRRGWDKVNDKRGLAISMMLECSELLDNFQWSNEPKDAQNTVEELADVFIYGIALADKLGVDLSTIIKEKLQKNLIKYPEPSEK